MSDPSTNRDAVISSANVLMVALLKMNRLLIPAILKWRRSRRLNWIQRAAIDQCRKDSRRQQGRCRFCWGSAALSQNGNGTGGGSGGNGSSNNGQDTQGTDDRLRLVRIQALKEAREQRIDVFAYTSVMTVFVTLLSIAVYAGVIISVVLTQFPFSKSQAIVFSFTLIATAVVSEAEVLMRRVGVKDKKKKKRDPSEHRRIRPPARTDPFAQAEAGHGPLLRMAGDNGGGPGTRITEDAAPGGDVDMDSVDLFSDIG